MKIYHWMFFSKKVTIDFYFTSTVILHFFLSTFCSNNFPFLVHFPSYQRKFGTEKPQQILGMPYGVGDNEMNIQGKMLKMSYDSE